MNAIYVDLLHTATVLRSNSGASATAMRKYFVSIHCNLHITALVQTNLLGEKGIQEL